MTRFCWSQFVEHFWFESVSPFLINPLKTLVNIEILYGLGLGFFVGGFRFQRPYLTSQRTQYLEQRVMNDR